MPFSGKRKTQLRWAGYISGGALAILGTTFVFLLFVSLPIPKSFVSPIVSKLGGPINEETLTIENLGFSIDRKSLQPTIHIGQLQFENDTYAISLKKGSLISPWRSILLGNIAIQEVHIGTVSINEKRLFSQASNQTKTNRTNPFLYPIFAQWFSLGMREVNVERIELEIITSNNEKDQFTGAITLIRSSKDTSEGLINVSEGFATPFSVPFHLTLNETSEEIELSIQDKIGSIIWPNGTNRLNVLEQNELEDTQVDLSLIFTMDGFSGDFSLTRLLETEDSSQLDTSEDTMRLHLNYSTKTNLLTVDDVYLMSSPMGIEMMVFLKPNAQFSGQQFDLGTELLITPTRDQKDTNSKVNQWELKVESFFKLSNVSKSVDYLIRGELTNSKQLIPAAWLPSYDLNGTNQLSILLEGGFSSSGDFLNNRGKIFTQNIGNPPEEQQEIIDISFLAGIDPQNQSLIFENFIVSVDDYPSQYVADFALQTRNSSENNYPIAKLDVFQTNGDGSNSKLTKIFFGNFSLEVLQKKTFNFKFDLTREEPLSFKGSIKPNNWFFGNPVGNINIQLDEGNVIKNFEGNVSFQSEAEKKTLFIKEGSEITVAFSGTVRDGDILLEKSTLVIFPYSFHIQGKLTNFYDITSNEVGLEIDILNPNLSLVDNLDLIDTKRAFNLAINYSKNYLNLNLNGQADAIAFILGWDSIRASPEAQSHETAGRVNLDLAMDLTSRQIQGMLKGSEIEFNPRRLEENIVLETLESMFIYDQELNKVNIQTLELDTNYFDLVAQGDIFLELIGSSNGIYGNLEIVEIRSDNPDVFDTPLDKVSGGIEFSFDMDQNKLIIGQSYLAKDQVLLLLSGDISFSDSGNFGSINYNFTGLNQSNLISLWPVNLYSNPRKWVLNNASKFTIENAHGGLIFSGNSNPVLNQTIEFSDLEFTYINGFPPISNTTGYLLLTNTDLSMSIEEGEIFVEDKGVIQVGGSRLYIPQLDNSRVPSSIFLHLDGLTPPLFALLDLKPFELLKRGNIPQDIIAGSVTGQVHITLPLITKVPFNLVTLDGLGSLKKITSQEIAFNKSLSSELLEVKFDETKINISGLGNLGNSPISLEWKKDFQNTKENYSVVEGQLDLTKSLIEDFSIPFIGSITSGSNPVDYNIRIEPNKPTQLKLSSNLKDIQFELAELGWLKPKGIETNFEAIIQLSQPISVPLIELESEDLSFLGNIALSSNNQFSDITFDQFQLKDHFSGELSLTRVNNGIFEIKAKGQVKNLDYTKILQGGGTSEFPPIRISIQEIEITEGIILSQVQGNVNFNLIEFGSFSSMINNRTHINGKLEKSENEFQITITSEDSGKVIEDLGFVSNADGGAMQLVLKTSTDTDLIEGELFINELNLSLSPILANEIFTNQEENENSELRSYRFEFIGGKFKIDDDLIDIENASGFFQGSGISAQGEFNLTSREFDLTGGVTLLSQLSTLMDIVFPIRWLLPRENEEVLTWEYRVNGKLDNPNIDVNPIPKLTPALIGSFFVPGIIPIL